MKKNQSTVLILEGQKKSLQLKMAYNDNYNVLEGNGEKRMICLIIQAGACIINDTQFFVHDAYDMQSP